MVEKHEEGWRDATRAPEPRADDHSGLSVRTIPTREAMGWIRALANDWEDERSRLSDPTR